ncbi:MAG: hypothetical protein LBQ76_07505 [Candidatus Fibromonas sp.]|jgi:hypothetical protein|nr:hypothetical protein [Candidatus Fibromonas sp.]
MTLLNRFLLCVSFFVGVAFAQEPPNKSILVSGKIPPGFYRAGIRYGEAKDDSLYIKWSRTVKADTFWVYKANSNLEYITNAGMRTVWYNQPMRYERRMAAHHLREYILDSPLRFSYLDSLANNNKQQLLGKELHEYFMR